MTDETYNGWTNRQTWLVHLWLTNDEGTYNATREIVADRLASDMETDRYILGGILEDWTEQVIYGEDVAPANLSTDLVNDALGRVNLGGDRGRFHGGVPLSRSRRLSGASASA